MLRSITVILLLSASTISQGATIRSKNGVTATVANDAASAFQCFVSALDAVGYPIKFMGGLSAGHMRHSLHHTGHALDVNQYARGVTRPRMPHNEVSLAHGCGLVAGALWCSQDSGHVQKGGYEGCSRHVRSHARSHHHHRRSRY